MSGFLIILIIVLLLFVILQISKATELLGVLRGEEEELESNRRNAFLLLITGLGTLVYTIVSIFVFKDRFLPVAASEQGVWIDGLIRTTFLFTGIVFVITQVILFVFVYKYQFRKGKRAYFFPHNNSFEIVWTLVPAIVLTILVVSGLNKWNKIFSPAPEDAVVIEATAQQFKWNIRYPGKDKALGPRDFTLVNSSNELGINWNMKSSHDDFIADSIVLPVNTPVLVKIGALDVLHNFNLPHFRMKLDAVPGIPTEFWFRPTITTDSMRLITEDANFNYELACAELCGTGHWNMRKLVKIVSKEKYEEWFNEQESYYELVVAPTLASKNSDNEEQWIVVDENKDVTIIEESELEEVLAH